MSDYSGLGQLVEEIKAASETIAESDAQNARRLDAIEKNVNELHSGPVVAAVMMMPLTSVRTPPIFASSSMS